MAKCTESCTSESDLRGKHPPKNKSTDEQIKYVQEHIESFPMVESHYCRKDTNKKYLDSELNLKKMYRLYEEKAEQEGITNTVKENIYRQVSVQYTL